MSVSPAQFALLITCIIAGRQWGATANTLSAGAFTWNITSNFYVVHNCQWPSNTAWTSTTLPKEECIAKCVQTPQCTHFSWARTDGGKCWLINTVQFNLEQALANGPNEICGKAIRQDPAAVTPATSATDMYTEGAFAWNVSTSNFYWARNCKWPGNSTWMTSTIPRSEECSAKCLQTPLCSHFTWRPDNGGTCYLITEIQWKLDKAVPQGTNDICGKIVVLNVGTIRWNVTSNFHWAENCKWPSDDTWTTSTLPKAECSTKCLQAPQCTHFTWRPDNGGTCFIVSVVQWKLEEAVARGTNDICGKVVAGASSFTWNETTNLYWKENCKWPPHNSWTTSLTPKAECATKCLQTSQCTHFTWRPDNGGTCWLVTGVQWRLEQALAYGTNDMCGKIK